MSEHEFDFLSKMIKNMISYPKKQAIMFLF